MRKFDFPYISDWFAVSLRWLILTGMAVSLALDESLTLWLTSILLFGVLWNTFISILAAVNQRMTHHRIINTVVDGLICAALFALSGGVTGPLSWSALLGIASAAIYFELRGSLLVAGILAVLQGGWTFFSNTAEFQPLLLLQPFAFNLLAGAIAGFASNGLMKRLRKQYRNMVTSRNEITRHVKQQENIRTQAFYKILETLSTTLNYQIVLDIVLDLSNQIIGTSQTDRMISAVLLFSGRNLRIESGRRMPPRDLKITFHAKEGALQQALTTGEPVLVSKPVNDPELRNLVILHDCQSALCLPLMRGLDAYGIMLYAHPAEKFFSDERVEILEMLSNQAVIAIQNARLFEQLQEEKQILIDSQEVTRNQLARDLHDGPTQSVSAIAMRISISRKMLEMNQHEDLMKELENIEDLARRTTNEIRHMLFTLRPLVLESKGLTAAMEAMAIKMNDNYDQNVKTSVEETLVSKLDISKQTVIFYLVEEAVNNARKHAKASLIQVRLRYVPGEEESVAALEIIDNGVGFDVQAVTSDYEQRGSLGMINLQERSEMINGLLEVDSKPSKGTRVRVLIPLTEEATDRLTRGLITVK
jgi:signal transduction histidine kinase